MKSQVTQITAATLLSADEGASILANLMATDLKAIDLYNVLLSGRAAEKDILCLLPADQRS